MPVGQINVYTDNYDTTFQDSSKGAITGYGSIWEGTPSAAGRFPVSLREMNEACPCAVGEQE
jgi:hypothetical protein